MPIQEWSLDHHRSWVNAIVDHFNGGGLPAGLRATVETRRVVIGRDDAVVARIELLTPDDKRDAATVAAFVGALRTTLDGGVHVVLIDLLPPGPFDPSGMHGALRERMGGRFAPPPGQPLTVTAYTAGTPLRWKTASTAIGSPIPDPCLSLDRGRRVRVPLDATYMAARETLR